MLLQDNVTQLLKEWSNGNETARDELIPIVEDELRRIANRYMKKERPDQPRFDHFSRHFEAIDDRLEAFGRQFGWELVKNLSVNRNVIYAKQAMRVSSSVSIWKATG